MNTSWTNSKFLAIYIARTVRIGFLSLGFVIAFLFRRLFRRGTGQRLTRWYFETCGGGIVKCGQILAMRYDLVPAEYCEELSKLLDRLPPVKVQTVTRVIETDLGRPLSDCFSRFDPDPIATASVAQVHQATLPEGDKVVIKVKRPGIAERFRVDLLNAKLMARLIDRTGLLGNISARRLADEIVRLAEEELNFHQEARNAQLLHELLKEDDLDHYAPKVYFRLCGASVITMEKLEGVWMTDLISAVDKNDRRQLELWSRQGITPRRTARLVMRSILAQCFSHRLFHADPHAANMILMEGGTLGYVDFGMVGWLDERAWLQQFKLREYISNEMIHAAYEILLDILEPLPSGDLSQFEHEVKALIRDYIMSSKNPSARILEKSIGYFFLRMCDVIRRARLSVPASMMRVYRAASIGDMVMLKLYPNIDWSRDLKEFIREETRRQLSLLITGQQIITSFNSLLMKLLSVPHVAAGLLDWAQHRLPELGRESKRQLSIIEQAFLVAFDYVRMGSLLIAIVILSAHWLTPRYFSAKLFVSMNEAVGNWWWLLAGSGLLINLLVGRAMRRLDVP